VLRGGVRRSWSVRDEPPRRHVGIRARGDRVGELEAAGVVVLHRGTVGPALTVCDPCVSLP
jgi:hypothetical protein